MSQSDKAAYYAALKGAGVSFEKHYRDYSTAELKAAYDHMQAATAQSADEPLGEMPSPSAPLPAGIPAPLNEMPGQRLNTKDEDEPLRVDEQGLVWFQEEVRKPASPRPRGRRVLRYNETGTKVQSAQVGDYMESFEVAGDEVGRSAEIKITMPSYQVGIYQDPRFPFKIHIYNEIRGFDFDEVNEFYGGADMVPDEINRTYVENVLAYDIRTTIRAIQAEARQLQLQGRM